MPEETVQKQKTTVKEVIISVACIGMCLFHLYTAVMGIFPIIIQRSVHMTFVLFLVFLIKPTKAKSKVMHVLDYVLCIVATASAAHVWLSYDRFSQRIQYVSPVTLVDKIMCIAMIVLVLEGIRRIAGKALPIIVIVFIIYCFTCQYLPGLLYHRKIRFNVFIENMYMGYEAMFGSAVGASATFLFLFILFGSFLEEIGSGSYFIDLANALVGRTKGGAAKAAVVSSCIFGSISGSAVANVYGTGVMTIPMMKKLKYDSTFAGAVEAVASTGGQIMPPVMGAVAFIMAELLEMPYMEVVKAALIPGLLYYVALILMVHFRAVKLDLKPMTEGFATRQYLLKNSYLLLPLITLIVVLCMGYTAGRAVSLALVVIFIIGIVTKRLTIKGIYHICLSTAKSAVTIALACCASGVIVGVLVTTGLGVAFTSIVMSIAKGFLPFALLMTAIACLILGMGVPTSAAYIITSSLCTPVLLKMGVNPTAAHLFALYFACISAITPPVAMAAYAGAHIAGADMFKTGVQACKLGITAFLMPFMFVYNPSLLMQGTVLEVLRALATCMIAGIGLSCAVEGYLFHKRVPWWMRIFAFAAAILLIDQSLVTDLIGLGVIALLLAWDRIGYHKPAAPAQA